MLTQLMRDKAVGKQIVPIIPDEARTFGMDGMFRTFGIYAHAGQLYEPVDADQVAYYKESRDGQILEEGITEAGAMSSFIAAGTAYANHQIDMIPFYVYYSMFGFQRIGDLVWEAADMRCKGFLVGGTAGRTTLNGEGLQHEDGHSHLLFSAVPNCRCYDPAYGYEIATIVKHGIKQMYGDREDVFYYMTVGNENYEHLPRPDRDVDEGIIKGAYLLKPAEGKGAKAQLLGSSAILGHVIKAQEILADYGVAADVWSVTSYVELRRDALDCERHNLLNPDAKEQVPYVTQTIGAAEGPVIASSDYMKILPDGIGKWLPQGIVSLGTDGFGRSETRAALRDFFEIDERYITLATLKALADRGEIDKKVLAKAIKAMKIDPEKLNPMHS